MREFFIWQEMKAEPCQRELYLLRAMRRRGLEKNLPWRKEDEKAFEKQNEAALFRYRIEFKEYRKNMNGIPANNADKISPLKP